ncbi:hypothetical protein AB0F15_16315 [Amycolatopsis sp. NPDC026612]|uniref:hypothetical protein n=1 Tax=Amycolatopsis sp. NPDC026612 TaxID=3155466 RepID=UPI0033F5CFB3
MADDAARQAGISPDVPSRVDDVFAEAELEASALVAAAFDGDGIAVDEMTADPFAMIARRLQPDVIVERIATRLRTEFAGQPGAELYVAAYVAATLRRPRKPLLLRALLAAICGHVEVCILRILRRELMTRDRYSDISDPQLETDVRKLMVGGLPAWRSHLDSLLGVDVTAGSAEWPGVVEPFERRHLLVHREGLVDHRYRMRVSDAPPADHGRRVRPVPRLPRRPGRRHVRALVLELCDGGQPRCLPLSLADAVRVLYFDAIRRMRPPVHTGATHAAHW